VSRTLAAIVIAALLAGPALGDEDPAHVEVTTTRVLMSDTLPPLDRARTLVTRGLAREALHRPKDAFDDFTYALSLHALPVDEIARARYDRAVVLEELGRNDEALADYTAAINLQPRFAAGLNNRANLYRRLGRLDDASRDYTASLASGNPQPEYPLYGLGQISEALGRADTARNYYQQALAANPHFDLAAQRLAVLNGPQPLAPLAQPAAQPKPAPAILRPPKDEEPSPPHKSGPLPMGPAPVQLGAFRDEAMATAEWNKIVARLGPLFAGFSPHILPLDQGARRLYRLQAGPFTRPRDICKEVRAAGFGCFPARDPQSQAAAAASP
jgi:tetratricopeptide (TPR) repeat protein